jgi:hypothetical protein
MKKKFTLTCLVIATLISRAASDEGRITITNLSYYDVLIEIDGKRYDDGNKNITIPYLQAGNHTLHIAQLPGRLQQESTAPSGNQEKVIYNNTITIRPEYHTDIVINRFNKVMVDELSMTDKQYLKDADNRYTDDRWMNADASWYSGTYRPLSRQAFYSLQELMGSELSGTKRLELAKEVIDQNYFTAMQVKLLADLFTSDERALEIAEYAYPKTINKNEFFVVYNRFVRGSSREKLADFIKKNKVNSEPVNKP